MNSNKFVYSVIAVLISVVFIGSCLAPVVMDAVTGDKQTITLSNDDTGATTFVYKLAAADSIVGNISTGEYTITAGGTDYTTTTDSLLISPDEGIIAPDIQNGKIVIYSSEGVTEELPIEKITKVVASNKTTWILTEDGHVYGCGEKGGKQSSGDNLNVIVFTDRTPADKVVTQVACTTGDTWIVTQDGRVYGCGGGSYGQQGSGETNSVSIFTDRTPADKVVTQVACSGETTWIVTQDGHVYGCGRNQEGQQGSGDNNNITVFTDRTPADKVVTQVACSISTTLLLTQDGKVYGSGSYNGKTSSNNQFIDSTPTDKIVTKIACAKYNSWIVTQDGKAYASANNSYGQGGTGTAGIISTFTDVTPADKVVTQVACSDETSWIVTQDGHVFGCGRSTRGQQGTADTANITIFTDRTPADKVVTQVACSDSTTWFVTQDGHVFGCGYNYYGEQGSNTSGSGTDVTTFTDRTPADKVVTQVACSANTTWIVTQDGRVLGCGYNNDGQQGSNTSGSGTDVTTFTDRTPELTSFTIQDKADYYLITDAADIPNQYLYITNASTGYYADPSDAIVFETAASSYFVSVGATAGSHYGTLPTLATVNGTDTQLSPDYHVYQYSDSFPVTADGASTGLAGFVELEYQGEVGQGGLDPTFGTLLVLTVTFAIIGVVLAAVRMIGGRE